MNKKGKSISKEVTILVLAGIILALIIGGGSIAGLFGLFNSADPVRVAQNNEEVCPQSIWVDYQNQGSFNIQLRNGGSEGGMFVKVSSKYFLVKNNDRDDFANSSLKSWRVPAGQYQNYDFKTKRINQTAGNVSINVEYGCEGLFCSKLNFCCKYEKEGTSDRYQFVKESCV